MTSTGPAPGLTASSRRGFVADQIAGLEPLGFVVVGVAEPPYGWVRVGRAGDGPERSAGGSEPGNADGNEDTVADAIDLDVGLADPKSELSQAQADTLAGAGFSAKEPATAPSPSPARLWRRRIAPADPHLAADVVEQVLAEVFSAESSTRVEVRHGSMREELEVQRKLAAMRSRVEPVLTAMIGRAPEQDPDGDFVVDVESARVFVAPRASPDRPSIIRVFAITNLDVEITPDLGTYLAKVNFGLMFGRFALDVEGRSVWFDETLLGEHITDELLRFTVQVVADTANDFDDRIAEQFGGRTFRGQPAPPSVTEPTANKPGQAGYL